MDQETPKETTRHWTSLEELNPSYWRATESDRAQEFVERPMDALANLTKADQKGLHRREFLTVMSASIAMASAACARRPVHKIIPYVVKPEEITPGVPNWYASTCGECSQGCGILTKNREGRPIKLEGNPDHSVNQGKLCVRGQASLLNLYDADRLKHPIRNTDSGQEHPTWKEVDAEIGPRLRKIATGQSRVRILSGPLNGSKRRIVREFLAAFRDGKHVEFEALSDDHIAEAQFRSYGTRGIPTYRFDKADVVLSLGADFLGTQGSTLESAREWIGRRKLDSGMHSTTRMSKFYAFEPTVTITGANADERYGVRTGDEMKVALAVASHWIVTQKKTRYANDASLAALLKPYAPRAVAADIGGAVTDTALIQVAENLWKARGRSLVLGGGIQSRDTAAIQLQVAVNFLNSLLGNEGVTVDGTAVTRTSEGDFPRMFKLHQEMGMDQVDALIIVGANPVYHLPENMAFHENMKKVPLVISITDRMDETSKYAHFVLPDHHYLENWGDSNPRPGVYSLQQPAIRPLHNTRAFGDSLISWSQKGNLRVSGILSQVVAQGRSWYDYVRATWQRTLLPKFGRGRPFELFWEDSLRKGAMSERVGSPRVRLFRRDALNAIPRFAATQGIVLSLYSKVSMGDGRSANNAWLQEIPDPISTVTWDNYLNVSPALATRLSLKENDVVSIRANDRSVEAPVHIQPGMHAAGVSLAVGYGRTAVGKVGNGAGVNAFRLTRVEKGRIVFSGQSVDLKKTGRRYELAATQGHHRTKNRPIINDISLDDYRKNPATENHTNPHLRWKKMPNLWPRHEYKGNRWGMSIDLSACTGCSACVVACQAENNIPVVGRNQVRVGREMHWIRIDRYYSGAQDYPEMLFQPMLCQHCENASCETVCPVLATVHSDDGLNQMAYNRCVGTRYCQNNCPYKVRRFNFFDHWKAYAGTANLVWNPDVTVRSRGIMEKCSFCVQRINARRIEAKKDGRKLRDGEILTACQQTCPTDAIKFGDINDAGSAVAKAQRDLRSFRALEATGNLPVVSYLSKVRNRGTKKGGEDVHHV